MISSIYWWQILFTLIVVNTLYHAPSFLSKPKKILKILTKNVNPPNWMSEQVSICWIPGLLTERKHFQVPLVIWILLDEMTLAEAVSYLFGQCVTWMLHHPDNFIFFIFWKLPFVCIKRQKWFKDKLFSKCFNHQ